MCLKKQLTKSLEKKFNKNNIIVAYEPIWSIGTGKIPTLMNLTKQLFTLKKFLKNIFKKKVQQFFTEVQWMDKTLKCLKKLKK